MGAQRQIVILRFQTLVQNFHIFLADERVVTTAPSKLNAKLGKKLNTFYGTINMEYFLNTYLYITLKRKQRKGKSVNKNLITCERQY